MSARHLQILKTSRLLGMVGLWLAFMLSPLVGCVPPPQDERLEQARAVGPDSGDIREPLGTARWRSLVDRGRVVVIVERVALHGALVGERRYEFDSLGTLRRLSERVQHVSARTPGRTSTIEFRAGVPVLATRESDGAPESFTRDEMGQLERRGYAFFDSAHRALPR